MTSTPPIWTDDTGSLVEGSRRALLELIKGPYLSGRDNPGVWSALLADEDAVRSRLHDLFLDLVLDRVAEFAFVRNVRTDELATPSTVRSASLTFLDTAMLLVLRQMLLTDDGAERVIVSRDDVFEQARAYRTPDRDEADFQRRLNASWGKMQNVLRVVHEVRGADDDRVEISPVLALIVDAEQVRAIRAEYDRIIRGDADVSGEPSEAASDAASDIATDGASGPSADRDLHDPTEEPA